MGHILLLDVTLRLWEEQDPVLESEDGRAERTCFVDGGTAEPANPGVNPNSGLKEGNKCSQCLRQFELGLLNLPSTAS